MITVDKTRQLPDEWTDRALIDLFDHARDLGHNGNPAGFGLTIDLAPFVARQDAEGEHRLLNPVDEWDLAGMRSWVELHPDEVLRVLQFNVLPEWW